MIDPATMFGIIVGALQILQQTAEFGDRLLTDSKALERLRHLQNEIHEYIEVLGRWQPELSGDARSICIEMEKLLRELDNNILQCQNRSKLKSFYTSVKASVPCFRDQLMKALNLFLIQMSIGHQKQSEKLFDMITSQIKELESNKISFSGIGQAVEASSLRVQRATEDIRYKLDTLESEVYDMLRDLWLKSHESSLDDILEWLCPKAVNPQVDQQIQTKLRTKATSEWIFQHPLYISWKDTDTRLFWLHGGSTCPLFLYLTSSWCWKNRARVINGLFLELTKRSSIIERLSVDLRHPSMGMAYFFCDGRLLEKLDPRFILGSLVRQLLDATRSNISPSLFKRIKTLHAQNVRNEPSLSALFNVLDWILELYGTTYILLDGIDECDDLDDVLAMVQQLGSKGSLHLFAASRYKKDIENALQGAATVHMDVDNVLKDIATYIDDELTLDRDLSIHTELMKMHIKDRLLSECQGMFKWVQCHLEALKEQETENHIIKTLKQLPSGLFITYRNILRCLTPARLDIVRKALAWLVYCKRPLTLDELAMVVAISPDDSHFDIKKKLRYPKRILELLGSLIHHNSETSVVEIAHHSVKEFIRSSHNPDGSVNEEFISTVDGHGLILKSCLLIIRSGADSRCLENYSVMQWHEHAREVETDKRHCDFIVSFFTEFSQRQSFAWWVNAYRDDYDPRRGGIYWAVRFRLLHVLDRLLHMDIPDREYQMEDALLNAAYIGDAQAVQLLVLAGTDIMTRDWLGRSALHLACRRNLNCVRVLVERGADLTACDNFNDTPLDEAFSYDLWEIVKEILELKGELNQSKKGGTLLHRAVSTFYGTRVLAGLLLMNLPLESRDKYGETPLSYAAAYGSVEHLKILLAAGADVGSCTEGGWTSLHQAASNGAVESVELLLQAGAKVDAETSDQQTPLHVALGNYPNCTSALNITKSLLLAGANVEMTDAEGNTPLHNAVKLEAHAITRLKNFWTYGEEYDAIPWKYSDAGREYLSAHDTVRLLISANPRLCSMSNTKGNTPLHETLMSLEHVEKEKAEFGARAQSWVDKSDWKKSRTKTYDTVRTLLSSMSRVGLSKPQATPYLMLAVKSGSSEMVELFLADKSNMSDKDVEGNTSLHHAVKQGDKEVIKLLVDAGALVAERNYYGFTAVHVAIMEKRYDIAATLATDSDNIYNGDSPLGFLAPDIEQLRANLESNQNDYAAVLQLAKLHCILEMNGEHAASLFERALHLDPMNAGCLKIDDIVHSNAFCQSCARFANSQFLIPSPLKGRCYVCISPHHYTCERCFSWDQYEHRLHGCFILPHEEWIKREFGLELPKDVSVENAVSSNALDRSNDD